MPNIIKIDPIDISSRVESEVTKAEQDVAPTDAGSNSALRSKREILEAEMLEIHQFVSDSWQHADAEQLSERLTVLSIYLARTADMLGEAEFLLSNARGCWTEMLNGMQATELREILAMKTAAEQRLATKLERLNAAIVHQIDAVRSQLSFCKQELASVNYGGLRR